MILLPEPDAYGQNDDYSERTRPYYKAETVVALLIAERERCAMLCEPKGEPDDFEPHVFEALQERAAFIRSAELTATNRKQPC